MCNARPLHLVAIFTNVCLCRWRNAVCTTQCSADWPRAAFRQFIWAHFHQLQSQQLDKIKQLTGWLYNAEPAERNSYTCSSLQTGSISESDEEWLHSQSAGKQGGSVFVTVQDCKINTYRQSWYAGTCSYRVQRCKTYIIYKGNRLCTDMKIFCIHYFCEHWSNLGAMIWWQ